MLKYLRMNSHDVCNLLYMYTLESKCDKLLAIGKWEVAEIRESETGTWLNSLLLPFVVFHLFPDGRTGFDPLGWLEAPFSILGLQEDLRSSCHSSPSSKFKTQMLKGKETSMKTLQESVAFLYQKISIALENTTHRNPIFLEFAFLGILVLNCWSNSLFSHRLWLQL